MMTLTAKVHSVCPVTTTPLGIFIMTTSSESARLKAPPLSVRQHRARIAEILKKGLIENRRTLPSVPDPMTPSQPAPKRGRQSVMALMPQAEAIAKAYSESLKSYRELAKQYNCTLPTIQALLLIQGVAIRKAGRVLGKENDGGDQQSKLSPYQRQWMLKQDLAGMPHSEIGAVIGVSRERVRQLCQRAGHPTRRERVRLAREQNVLAHDAVRVANEAQRLNAQPNGDVVTASMLWAKGDDIAAIAKAMHRNPNSLGVQIARWRHRWPSMFQRRYARHVN